MRRSLYLFLALLAAWFPPATAQAWHLPQPAAVNGNTATYHYDYRGSTVALTDNTGNVTDRMEYSAYGLTTYRSGTTDTPFLFNGRYGVQTEKSGLLYMRARYYNPYLCRFVSADGSGFAGGLNWYAFANGNPVSYLDPFGLCSQMLDNASWSWVNNMFPDGSPGLNGLVGLPSSVQQQLTDSLSWAAMGLDFNPNAYQPTEPSTLSLILGLGGLLFANPEMGLMGGAEEGEMVTVTHFTDATTAQLLMSA